MATTKQWTTRVNASDVHCGEGMFCQHVPRADGNRRLVQRDARKPDEDLPNIEVP